LTNTGAEHAAFVPPPDPLHDHVHGPLPDTGVAVPAEHKFDDGADPAPVPFADPQDPLTGAAARVAEQLPFEPPPDPLHDHVYVLGLVVTAVAEPVLHKFDDGGVENGNVPPFDVPHVPFTTGGARVAEQLAFVPPSVPPQTQLYVVPVVEIGVGFPALHKFDDGGVAFGNVPPFDAPQAPSTGPAAIFA
jgi:hypothetical protein